MYKKNGKIEFFRFVFCISIILFHLNRSYFNLELQITDSISFFKHGRIGVEFFFIVTGYLLAKHCWESTDVTTPVGQSTAKYVFSRWLNIFPYHLIAFVATFIGVIFINGYGIKKILERLLESIPNFFMIIKTGVYEKNIMGQEWYISVMLLALLVLYPLCRKYYDEFTRIIAPLTGILLIGYLCQKYGSLSEVSVWDGLVSKALIRGLAEICIGAFIFECSRFLKKLSLSKTQKIILTFIEYGGYLFVLVFICSTWKLEFEVYALLAIAVSVCLSFSECTYGLSLFQNKFVMFLGRMSLPLYLIQTATRSIIKHYCSASPIYIQFTVILICTFICGYITLIFGDKLLSGMKKFISKMLKNSNKE